jgi:hypothetical protein
MNTHTDGDSLKVAITKDSRKLNGWVQGETTGGYRFQAKVFDNGSEYGIDNGRVSKLEIRWADGGILVNYDRGWDVKPRTPEVKAAYDRVMAALNALDKVTEVEKPKDFLAKIAENKQKVSHDSSASPAKSRGDELC